MQLQELARAFKYNSVPLSDPNPNLTLPQVRDFYASVYPELVSAEIEGPELNGNKQTYTFRRAVGTKGAEALRPAPYKRAAIAIGSDDGQAMKITHLSGWAATLPNKDNCDRRFMVLDFDLLITQINDLSSLADIGWFAGVELNLIDKAKARLDYSHVNKLSRQDMVQIGILHAEHCSRTRDTVLNWQRNLAAL